MKGTSSFKDQLLEVTEEAYAAGLKGPYSLKKPKFRFKTFRGTPGPVVPLGNSTKCANKNINFAKFFLEV